MINVETWAALRFGRDWTDGPHSVMNTLIFLGATIQISILVLYWLHFGSEQAVEQSAVAQQIVIMQSIDHTQVAQHPNRMLQLAQSLTLPSDTPSSSRHGDVVGLSHVKMAFSKKKVDDGKTWLRQYKQGTFLDQSVDIINYTDFVNKELIQLSTADLARFIPSVVDGFKPGQRKILLNCSFKKNFVKHAEVAQFSGYVSEHSAYHHGETSLASTIIGMAQNFVGSNNINLLASLGQFGTRNQGGKNHASSRYICTCVVPITRLLFPEADDMLLDYLKEDGQTIEPVDMVRYDSLHGTDTLVDFEIQLSEEHMAIALSQGLTKKFKLSTNLSTSNMQLFDADGTIRKYDPPEMSKIHYQAEVIKCCSESYFVSEADRRRDLDQEHMDI